MSFPVQIPDLLFISRPHNCVLSASRDLVFELG
jgi:hypothetical protein